MNNNNNNISESKQKISVSSSSSSSSANNNRSNLHTYISKHDNLEPESVFLFQEEMKNHSLLNRPDESLSGKMLSLKRADFIRTAGNFLGGGLVTANDQSEDAIDGFSPQLNFTIWKWLISSLVSQNSNHPDVDKLKGICDGIDQATNYLEKISYLTNIKYDSSKNKKLAEKSLEVAKEVYALQPGDSYLLPGGWSTPLLGGHAILHQFKRNNDQTFDILLFTSTNFQLTDVLTKGNKTRIKPVIRYKSVPEKMLFFGENKDEVSASFFQALMELKVLNFWNINQNAFEQEDLLEIFDHLAEYQTPVSLDEFGAITGQRGGTCVPSSTKAWIRACCGNKALYKQVIFRTKLQLLLLCYQQLKNEMVKDTKEGAQSRVILRQVAKKLLRRTAKLLKDNHEESSLFNEQLAKQALATGLEVIENVEEAESQIKKKRTSSLYISSLSGEVESQRYKRANIKVSPTFPKSSFTIDETELPNLSLKLSKNGSNFLSFLEESINQIEKLRNSDYYTLQIHHCIDQIPLPKILEDVSKEEPWLSRIDAGFLTDLNNPRKLDHAIDALHKIARLYLKKKKKDQLPRTLATFYPIQTLIHYLSIKRDDLIEKSSEEAKLSFYAIPYFGRKAAKLEELIYYDRDQFNRFQKANDYFKSFNERKQNNGVLFSNEESTGVTFDRLSRVPVNGKFWSAILSSNPSFQKEVNKRGEKKWPDFTEKEILEDQVRKKNNGIIYPDELKNLPPVTKRLMVCESEKDCNEIFPKYGYGYIWKLREIIFWGEGLYKKNSPTLKLTSLAKRKDNYESCGSVNKNGEFSQGYYGRYETWPDLVEKLHRSMNQNSKYGMFLANLDDSKRNTRYWNRGEAEANSLDDLTVADPFLKKIRRSLSEWKLTPFQMLKIGREHFNELSNPEAQAFFFRLFFRSTVSGKGQEKLGCGEMITKEKALLNYSKTFITKGLNYYYPLDNFLEGGRFFFELAFYLGHYLKSAGKQEQANELCDLRTINRWLEKEGITKSVVSTLHFYRVLYYANRSIDSLSTDDIASIYESWMHYHMGNLDVKWGSPFAENLAKEFIVKLTDYQKNKLCNYVGFRGKIFSKLIKSLGFKDHLEEIIWNEHDDYGFPIFEGTADNKCYYSIDLVKGRVYTREGLLNGLDKNRPWEWEKDFKRLFGVNNRFEYRTVGAKNVIFHHPQFGDIRIVKNDKDNGPSYVIQCQFPNSSTWYQYQNFEGTKRIPSSLKKDHAFWVPLEKNNEKMIGYLTTLKELKRKYILTSSGHIIEVDHLTGEPVENSLIVDGEYSEGLSLFDKNILRYCKVENESFVKVDFPKYSSLEGNPLKFFNREGKLVWCENQNYFLPKKMPKGYLGTIPNYLYLKADSGIDKLLVPIQKIATIKNAFHPNGSIKTSDQLSYKEMSNSNEMWGMAHYVVFSVKNHELVPTTEEAALFLAYVYFTQKRYSKAIKLIRGLNPLLELSTISLRILELIKKSEVKEAHPDAKMVILHALLVHMKRMDEKAINKVSSYFLRYNSTYFKFAVYLSEAIGSYNNISLSCRFSQEEEIWLIERLLAEKSYRIIGELSELFPSAKKKISDRLSLLKKVEEKSSLSKGKRIFPFSMDYRNRESLSYPYESSRYGQYRVHPFYMGNPPNPPKREWCSSDHEFEMEKEKFEQKREEFESNLKRETTWLDTGEEASFSTQSDGVLYRNGNLLLTVLSIAKKKSPHKRQEWIFKLKLWRLHLFKKDKALPYLDMMLTMLNYPHSFPEPFNKKATHYEKGKFLQECFKAYKENYYKTSLEIKSQKNNKYLKKEKLSSKNYPIRIRDYFDDRKKSVRTISKQQIKFIATFDKQDSRWNTLTSWKDYLDINPSNVEKSNDFEFKFHPNLLSKKEASYVKTLKRDLKILQQDYLAGKSFNNNQRVVSLDSNNRAQLKELVSNEKDAVENLLSEKTSKLLIMANKRPASEKEKLILLSKEGGEVKKALTLEDCVESLLSLDGREYLLKNPYLGSNKEITVLADLTLQVLDAKSYLAQLHRIDKLLKEIEESRNEACGEYYCLKLLAELESRYYFDEFDHDTQIALRVFSGTTGIIPYKKQTDLIMSMVEMSDLDPERFKDIVIQLIMGGGKTSVLATILQYLASKRSGKFALFIVPPSLFDTVKINLNDSLKKAFNHRLEAISISREEMTCYRLKRLVYQLERAKKKTIPIIVRATTLQSLELELLSTARQLAKSTEKVNEVEKAIEENNKQHSLFRPNNNNNYYGNVRDHKYEAIEQNRMMLLEKESLVRKEIKSHEERLRYLQKILESIKTSGDGLIDEVDLILDVLQEVNFPSGERQTIKPKRNQLLLEVYEALVSEDLKIDSLPGSPSIKEVVGLEKNAQSSMSKEVYLEHVVPVIALHLARTFLSIENWVGDFESSFVRYVSGQVPEYLQTILDNGETVTSEILSQYDPEWETHGDLKTLEADLFFLNYLRELHESQKDSSDEPADLIALLRHFLIELTPSTLSKSGNRDYGVKPNSKGKVIPYLSVNTPATTEFGYHWEEACYYYQWAAAFSPSEDQILDLAEISESMARYYVNKNGEKYEETVEYIEFLKLFNVPLNKIRKGDNLQKAVNFISSDIKQRFALQYENVARKVNYREERLTSGGADLVKQLHSRRAMSGIPWNVEGYLKTLEKRFFGDKGTEGRIFHALATKEKDGKLIETNLDSVESFMQEVYTFHPTPEKVRGIIEVGGLFKAFKNNFEVAKGIMRFFENKKSSKIKGVLFFHNDPGQSQPDTLYVWKKGASKPERIGGTSIALLKAKGLNPKDYFTFYDERHTTGTDILQLPDAINLLTFDEKILIRDVGQAIMRLRQFLFQQDISVVIAKSSKHALYNEGSTLNDLLLHAEKVQSVRKTRDMVRYFRGQIRNLFRSLVVNEILKRLGDLHGKEEFNHNAFHQLIKATEPFFVAKMSDAPFEQFGRFKQSVGKEVLINKLESELKKFTEAMELVGALDSIDLAEECVLELREHIEKTKSLPDNWLDNFSSIGVEVQVEQEVEVEQEIDLSLEQELELELQYYQKARYNFLRAEPKVTLENFYSMLRDLRSDSPVITTLQHQLQKYTYKSSGVKINYDRIFSGALYGTSSFFNSTMSTLPVFHRLQKPAEQILVVRQKEGIKWLLLCEREAKSIKKHLKALYEKRDPLVENVWLVQSDGSPFVIHEDHSLPPYHDQDFLGGLIEINVFNGNTDYLNRNDRFFEAWIKDDLWKNKLRFLKLKVAEDEKRNSALRTSPIIQNIDHEGVFATEFTISKARAEKEKQINTFTPSSQIEAKLCPLHRVSALSPESIEHLGVDINAEDELTLEALQQFENKIIKSIKGEKRKVALKKAAISFTKKQVQRLQGKQLDNIQPHHVQYLLKEQVSAIKEPSQICIFNEDNEIVEYLLKEEQIEGITKRQKHLIPYINPQFYPLLEKPWQIAKIPSTNLHLINETKWAHLSKSQVLELDEENLDKFLNLDIPPEKYSWISGNLLEKIPSSKYHHIVSDQIKQITGPNLVFKLEDVGKNNPEYKEGTWTSWIAPEMVPKIDFENSLCYLVDEEQIQAVPSDYVKLLDIEIQVPSISEEQVKALTDDQLKKCPFDLVKHVSPDKIILLGESCYPYLEGEEQIQAVTSDKIKLLVPKEDYKNGTENQMPWVSDSQLQFVTEDQVQGLSNEQILTLKGKVSTIKFDSLMKKLTPEQKESFDNQKLVDILTDEDIGNHLQEDQVKFLQQESQVQACPDYLFVHLSEDQIPKLSDKQVKSLGVEDSEIISNLADIQLQYLDNKRKTLQLISANRLHHMTVEQIEARDLSTKMEQFTSRAFGLFKTLLIPVILVAKLVVNCVRTLFTPCFNSKVGKIELLKKHLWRMVVADPLVDLMAPLQIIMPAYYLKYRSKWQASYAA